MDPLKELRRLRNALDEAIKALETLNGTRSRRGRVRTGLHWTQTPEGKAKLKRVMRASWRKRKAGA